MRRLSVLLIVGILAGMLAAPAAARSGPPEQMQVPFFFVAADGDYVLIVNATVQDLCAWVEAEFEGEPPVQQLVTLQVKETGKGALVVVGRATLYAELWEVEDGDFFALCDEAGTFLGTGTVHSVLTDNDLEVSLTRRNSFGDKTHGVIHGDDGAAWRVSDVFRAQVTQDEEFRLLVGRTRIQSTN